MKSSIKDVAEQAGVSIATVSRVINGKDRVNDITRQKVLQIIQELNFRPDYAARTLVKKETKTIGLFVRSLTNQYWAMLTDLISEQLWAYGYTVNLCNQSALSQDIPYIRTFLERRMDGIIWALVTDEGLTKEIFQNQIPVVAIQQKIPGAHRVAGDHIRGAMEAVNHLIGLGYQHIAHIGIGCPERDLGYKNAHMLSGRPINDRLIVHADQSLQNSRAGYQAARKLIQSGEPFDAVFCGNDATAFGAIKAIEETGRRVPEDVGVVGYDDLDLAAMYKPALTTIRQPIREMAVDTVKLLMDSIEKPEKTTAPQNHLFQMELIVRDSCGAKLRQK